MDQKPRKLSPTPSVSTSNLWQDQLETLQAVFVNLGSDDEPTHFTIESRYSETTAGVLVGFGTVARPQTAVKLGLTTEVIRLLAKDQPAGSIRLLVLPYIAEVAASTARTDGH